MEKWIKKPFGVQSVHNGQSPAEYKFNDKDQDKYQINGPEVFVNIYLIKMKKNRKVIGQ